MLLVELAGGRQPASDEGDLMLGCGDAPRGLLLEGDRT